MKTLEHLLSPIKIRNLEIPNRLVLPPMGTGLASTDSTVSDANLAYIRKRAASGVGLVITEVTAVDPLGQLSPQQLAIWNDDFIPGLSKMAQAIHEQGAKASLQLHHSGRENFRLLKKQQAVAPSAIRSFMLGFAGVPRELTIEEIQDLVVAFGAGARRAKAAGFDMVELHGAHGYLLMQFLSAHANQRTDQYGGDFKSRARFIIECLEETRRQVGPDFPISLRISAEECVKNGFTIEDVVSIVPDLVAAGADLLNVSFGTHGSPEVNTDTPNPSAPIEYAPGFKSHLARYIKEAGKVPVISVGRYTDPYFMDEVIARGDADMIAVARQNLADPNFLKNAIAGHPEDTLECLACNQGCIEREALEGLPVRCAINPQTGQELIWPESPAKVSRNVWVIGAGPAGLTAAAEAARLGHRVTLFEKEGRTGGNVRYAALSPHKEVYGRFIQTLTRRCEKLGVQIKTGVEVTEAMLEKEKPEVVVLAIGADKTACPAEGADAKVVCDAWQILDGSVEPKNNVVVIGAGLVGLETADFLREKGIKHITVVEMLTRPPVLAQAAHGQMLYRRLREQGVNLIFGTQVKKIEDDAVVVETAGEEKRIAPVEQVVVAIGVTPRSELKEMLAKSGIRHFVVGDAVAPRRIIEATTEGAAAAWDI
jgi:2,4-dienoyl-CoA reductase-like NADH-dependent reductase (Old Yellow Enzyme family)/thioredoxin reductase